MQETEATTIISLRPDNKEEVVLKRIFSNSSLTASCFTIQGVFAIFAIKTMFLSVFLYRFLNTAIASWFKTIIYFSTPFSNNVSNFV